MNPASFFCFALILTLLPIKILSNNSDLITKTCDATLYKDLCNSILHSDPASKNADLQGLAKIVLKIASTNATSIQDRISQMLTKNTSTIDNFFQACLKECAESFEDAIERIEESKPSLNAKRYGDVSTWVSTAMTDADTCEECFTEKPDLDSPIGDMSKVFSQICSIQLAITKTLSGN